MMKLKKSMKNRSAVSPVIATILMVAITVVLAAVLYVMVMGFGDNPANNATGALDTAKYVDAKTYKVDVVSISSSEVMIKDCKVNLLLGGNAGTAVALVTDTAGKDITIGSNTFNVRYQDVNGDEKLGAGDSLIITYSGDNFPVGSYELKLLGPEAQIAATTFTVSSST